MVNNKQHIHNQVNLKNIQSYHVPKFRLLNAKYIYLERLFINFLDFDWRMLLNLGMEGHL